MARIVLIEDNQPNMELMAYLLGAFGHEAIPAYDGEEGLAVLRERPCDLVVCDLQLPRIDGFEVLRHLRSDPEHQSLPVVAVTALAMAGDRQRALAAGFDGYISKPIDPETFVAEIETFLGGSNGAPRGESWPRS